MLTPHSPLIPNECTSLNHWIPSRNNKNNKKKGTRRPTQKRKINRPKTRPKRRVDSVAEGLKRQLIDPCHSPLSAGLYGTHEGMLSKMHHTISKTANFISSGDIGGCAIWFPDYTGKETSPLATAVGNLFVSSSFLANNTTSPTNTPINPFGTPASGMEMFADPSYAFVATDIVKDFRTVGACLTLGYTGKLADCQGEVTTTRMSLTDLLNANKLGSFTPNFTIDSIFQYAGSASRFTPAGVEAVWVPDEESHTFADERPGPFAVVEQAMAGVSPSLTSETMIERNPTALVIAWRGFASTAPLVIKTTKSFEWRPKSISGLTHVAVKLVAPPSITSQVANAARTSGLVDRLGDALTGGLATAANHLASAVYNGIAGHSGGPLHALGALTR